MVRSQAAASACRRQDPTDYKRSTVHTREHYPYMTRGRVVHLQGEDAAGCNPRAAAGNIGILRSAIRTRDVQQCDGHVVRFSCLACRSLASRRISSMLAPPRAAPWTTTDRSRMPRSDSAHGRGELSVGVLRGSTANYWSSASPFRNAPSRGICAAVRPHGHKPGGHSSRTSSVTGH